MSAIELNAILPLIHRTVRDLIDGEGGPSMEEARVIEIVDHRGETALTLAFVSAYGVH